MLLKDLRLEALNLVLDLISISVSAAVAVFALTCSVFRCDAILLAAPAILCRFGLVWFGLVCWVGLVCRLSQRGNRESQFDGGLNGRCG